MHTRHLHLTTTAMASNGQAVARTEEGKVVFVAGALPGETVRAQLTDERAKYSTARVVSITEASPDRVVPRCPKVAAGCGGCQWQHVAVPAQRRMKEEIVRESLARLGRVHPPELEPPELAPTVELNPWAYRTSLRTGVVDGRAGLRQHRSNELVAIDGCMIAHPLLRDLLDGRRYGQADQVVLRCGPNTGERMVATIPAGEAVDVPVDVSSDQLTERAAGREWQISTGSFFQSRTDGAEALTELVARAAGSVPGRAADLYSGVGLFAGVLAARGWSVVAVESNATALTDAKANLSDLDVRIVRRDVNRWTPEQVDLVVADPSRAGLGRSGVAVVAATGARRVVLISCDAASLGRDAGLLHDAGYRLTSVTPVDLFPQTFRVEVVSVFEQPGSGW